MNPTLGSDGRLGDWSQTFTGGTFHAFDPRASEIRLVDVAHALALQCRFAGHCAGFYSVAEHSVRVSRWIEATRREQDREGVCVMTEAEVRVEVLAGLVHDAAEAYLTDVIRPVKPYLGGYLDAERKIARAVELWAGLPALATEREIVKHADEVLLATEARDLMAPSPRPWRLRADPLAAMIEPWSWQHAEHEFLARARDLGVRE